MTTKSDAESPLAAIGGWPAVLGRLTNASATLGAEYARAAFAEILSGSATPSQIAGFAIGLRVRGESVEELAALVDVMFEFAVPVPLSDELRRAAICTCGTGGDRLHTVNVSTMATFAVAGAGAKVCKHGGRASSSSSGSADVLEALGVTLEITPAGVARCVGEVGFGFCLAPRFHPAMRHAASVRRELGVATLFNFLGPMANPGRVGRQVVGVGDPAMGPVVASVLAARGAERALVVFGHDGLDELSTTTTSTLLWVENGTVEHRTVDPRALGLAPATLDQLRGGSAAENAEIARHVLAGAKGPVRDIVVLNAAAGLVAAGVANELSDGIGLAAAAIDDGRAAAVLDALVQVSAAERELPA